MKHKGNEFQFYFIRHGESETNVVPGIAAGRNFDAPMTPRGHKQALALGSRLGESNIIFDRIYSSSLKRAVETTEGMMKGMNLPNNSFEIVDAIIERQIPAWRGKMANEVITPDVKILSGEKGKWFQPADGESERQVERRASQWIEEEFIDNDEWLERGGTHKIAIITHGITMRCIFHFITGCDSNFIRRTQILNCSISRFNFGPSGWSIISLNDACHTRLIGDIQNEGIEQGDTVTP